MEKFNKLPTIYEQTYMAKLIQQDCSILFHLFAWCDAMCANRRPYVARNISQVCCSLQFDRDLGESITWLFYESCNLFIFTVSVA